MDKDIFLSLYKSLVRPHIEYANAIWSPHLKRQSSAVERVQRRATKLVPGLRSMSYEDRLKFLKLPSLKFRRLRGDLIQTYKIFQEIDDIEVSSLFSVSEVSSTRNAFNKIYIQHSNTNIRKFSFSNRIAPFWNALDANVKKATNINNFKTALDAEKSIKDKMYIFDY